jgi:pyruvate formate lyase activating enzyme
VTTLLIPGLNDSEAELDELTAWVAGHLGAETPLHFSAFHPDGEMLDRPATPAETLLRAREQARVNGLRHVYVGNVRGHPDWTATVCSGCGARLIEREGFGAERTGMDEKGTVPELRHAVRRGVGDSVQETGGSRGGVQWVRRKGE